MVYTLTMELNHLRVFFEVAKVGRFTEAAKRLNISQSALSRSVALLEESEGVKLFERSKTGVTLTPLGAEVFLRCEQLFQKFDEIERVCRGTSEICEGTLAFAATDHITNDLLIKPLQAFRKKYPLVVPSIFTGVPDEIVRSLLENQTEFGLLFTKVAIPGIEYEVLRSEKMSLVCQPKLWKSHFKTNASKTLKSIIQEVGYIASIGATLQSRPSRVLKELFGEMPRIGVEANSQESQKRFCMEGGGIAYLANFMVKDAIKAGHLYEVPVGHAHEFNLWLAYRKGKLLTYTARTFLEDIRKDI